MSLFTSPVGPGIANLTQQRGQDLQFQAQMAEVGVREKALGVEKQLAEMQMSHQKALQTQQIMAEQQMAEQQAQMAEQQAAQQREFLAAQEEKRFTHERGMFDLEAEQQRQMEQVRTQQAIELQKQFLALQRTQDQLEREERRREAQEMGILTPDGRLTATEDLNQLRTLAQQEATRLAEVQMLDESLTNSRVPVVQELERAITATGEIIESAQAITTSASSTIKSKYAAAAYSEATQSPLESLLLNPPKEFDSTLSRRPGYRRAGERQIGAISPQQPVYVEMFQQFAESNDSLQFGDPAAIEQFVRGAASEDGGMMDQALVALTTRQVDGQPDPLVREEIPGAKAALGVFVNTVLIPYINTIRSTEVLDGKGVMVGGSTVVADGRNTQAFRAFKNRFEQESKTALVNLRSFSRQTDNLFQTVKRRSDAIKAAIESNDPVRMAEAADALRDMQMHSPFVFTQTLKFLQDDPTTEDDPRSVAEKRKRFYEDLAEIRKQMAPLQAGRGVQDTSDALTVSFLTSVLGG